MFRLAHILPAGESFELPVQAEQDLRSFLAAHPASDSSAWRAITSAVETSIPAAAVIKPAALLAFPESHFGLA